MPASPKRPPLYQGFPRPRTVVSSGHTYKHPRGHHHVGVHEEELYPSARTTAGPRLRALLTLYVAGRRGHRDAGGEGKRIF
jgi:hypothetical protein